jgi:hypothetical protein
MYQSLPAGARKREERKNDSGRRVAVLLMTETWVVGGEGLGERGQQGAT